ncbi:MAG: Transposase like protein [Pedosphaera sp.]|nr:Transposase like protein [Pedosphaera sp.]
MELLRRLEHVYTRHPVYFVTCCTEARKPLLANPSIHQAFTLFCQNALALSVFTGRYVLMPDHWHLFVTLPEDRTLSDWIKV